jgi:hypothetical protein
MHIRKKKAFVAIYYYLHDGPGESCLNLRGVVGVPAASHGPAEVQVVTLAPPHAHTSLPEDNDVTLK